MSNKEILKEIWKKEEALKQNLLTTVEVESLFNDLIMHLERTLKDDSIPSLKFKKLRAGNPVTWWSTSDGYPSADLCHPWRVFQPYLDLLAQFESVKTIKNRFKSEDLFVETRYHGNDLNLLIGKRDSSPDKAHIFIDEKTGEIRIEGNQQDPTELGVKIETVLTMPNGRRI